MRYRLKPTKVRFKDSSTSCSNLHCIYCSDDDDGDDDGDDDDDVDDDDVDSPVSSRCCVAQNFCSSSKYFFRINSLLLPIRDMEVAADMIRDHLHTTHQPPSTGHGSAMVSINSSWSH